MRGGSTTSLHGEGRASDLGHYVTRVSEKAAGDRLAGFLVAHCHGLGVQSIIWNRHIWSSSRPTWRPYGGQSPHTDHLHVELTWAGARTLTEVLFDQLLGTKPPFTPPTPEEDDEMGCFSVEVPVGKTVPIPIPPAIAGTRRVWWSIASENPPCTVRFAIGAGPDKWRVIEENVKTAPGARHPGGEFGPHDAMISVANAGPGPVVVLIEFWR